MAVWMVKTYWAITDKTSRSILLNSSKQLQAPLVARPLKNFVIAIKFRELEQLNTKHYFAKHLERSFVVSVLPVPTGPSGEPPKL